MASRAPLVFRVFPALLAVLGLACDFQPTAPIVFGGSPFSALMFATLGEIAHLTGRTGDSATVIFTMYRDAAGGHPVLARVDLEEDKDEGVPTRVTCGGVALPRQGTQPLAYIGNADTLSAVASGAPVVWEIDYACGCIARDTIAPPALLDVAVPDTISLAKGCTLAWTPVAGAGVVVSADQFSDSAGAPLADEPTLELVERPDTGRIALTPGVLAANGFTHPGFALLQLTRAEYAPVAGLDSLLPRRAMYRVARAGHAVTFVP